MKTKTMTSTLKKCKPEERITLAYKLGFQWLVAKLSPYPIRYVYAKFEGSGDDGSVTEIKYTTESKDDYDDVETSEVLEPIAMAFDRELAELNEEDINFLQLFFEYTDGYKHVLTVEGVVSTLMESKLPPHFEKGDGSYGYVELNLQGKLLHYHTYTRELNIYEEFDQQPLEE